MAIWKDPTPAPKAAEPARFDAPPPGELPVSAAPAPTPIRAVETPARESVIAGKFKGDVKVQGNLTIEQGAKVAGGVTANKVTLAGELDGNIESAQQVELQQSGVINGDLKAGSLTVAAGSRIRGHVECGWDKDGKSAAKSESGSAA